MSQLSVFFKHRRKGIAAFKLLHKSNLAYRASLSREEILQEVSGKYITERCYKFTFYFEGGKEAIIGALKMYRSEILYIEDEIDER